jgi:hypothetical protein
VRCGEVRLASWTGGSGCVGLRDLIMHRYQDRLDSSVVKSVYDGMESTVLNQIPRGSHPPPS